LADQWRIDPNRIRPAVPKPGTPAPRRAATQPLTEGPRTAPLDRARFGTQTQRGLTDPLPSLARVQAALGSVPAPVPARRAPGTQQLGLQALPTDQAFVTAAYRKALGRAPSRDELDKGMATLAATGDRPSFLSSLVSSPEFASKAARVDAAFQSGIPTALTLPKGGPTLQVLWPYPPGSRHGGPDSLATRGDMNKFGDYMAPFAQYFGAGTRGSQMLWVNEQAAKGQVMPGSEATKQLGAIAQSLFWDVPMRQNSDETLRRSGIAPDLNQPTNMVAYLGVQKQRVQDLIAKQDASDGPLHRQAAQELLAMVDGAYQRAKAFVAGDRSPVEAAPTGAFGVYNTARPVAGQPPVAFGPTVAEDPKAAVAAVDARVIANPGALGPDSFYRRTQAALLGG
jgi:hypothetical protein